MKSSNARPPESPAKDAKRARIDPQDVILVAGVASLLAGIAAWSRPAAAVVFGLMCFGFVYLVEAAKARNAGKGRGE